LHDDAGNGNGPATGGGTRPAVGLSLHGY
jgi:hypothetical protein